jgi:hypothetical protein
MINLLIKIMDLVFSGYSSWVNSQDTPRTLTAEIFGIWMIYQFVLHLWLGFKIWGWVKRKYAKIL